MHEDKERIRVHIYGKDYHLKVTPNSSAKYIRKVASLVDDQMKEVAASNPNLDLPRIAVLAALNIADQSLKLGEDLERQHKRQGREGQLSEENHRLHMEIEELRRKETGLHEELETIRKESEQLRANYEEELRRVREAAEPETDLREAYRQLKEEYAKLQAEYNEWVELVDSADSK